MDEITAQQEIAFIKKIMTDSRRIIYKDGTGFIFWGIIVVIGLIGTYFSIVENHLYILNWLWPLLIFFGWVVSFVDGRRKSKKLIVKTFAGKILSVVWISCGIAMTIIGFAGNISGALKGFYISPAISVILGIGFAITGFIYGKKWISALSIGWWLGALIMFFWPGLYSLLFFAAMMFLFQVVPGIIIYNKSKKEIAGTVQ